ncbi:Peroxin 13, N-terminal region-domain-containing protein [Lasiosphaeria miniovina]|uniref:Peroxisomal membrane protein PEX13 n=1 Tax=Lasiosphaeria miniovina TaxID=1954250 RepID=A0AA40EAG0_9PEZI|nr:Peroxin 13, N-terminal region-domain-containing protein [Lasiosphaeria miniovina]KAK0734359.1 Peroxin 13, N-terminal region-domain-containing protein [Lasiosphaeria miniovina]
MLPTTSSTTPAIPARPPALTASINQNAAAYSRQLGGALGGGLGGGLGGAPYGGYGSAYGSAYSSPYSSPYSRLGGMMGGYGGGMMGSYGGSYGGGMYGGGMMPGAGMPGSDPNNPDSLTGRFNMSTQATFQMLEGVVGAFGGFAQMLESTYMATHSSFFAMVAVAEQFGSLRDTLGSVLGIFTLMRWIRTLIARLTGRPSPVDATALTPAAFARFEGRQNALPDGSGGPPKPSRKPLFFFLLAAFGLPYVMSKVIRSLAANAEEEERRRQEQLVSVQQNQQQALVDPSQLEFCRVLYDFSPTAQGGQAVVVQGVDLEVHKGDLVAVLSKSDPLGNPSEWWKCRARDGRIGYLPATFLEVLRKPGQPLAIKNSPASDSSRANSLTSTASAPGVLTHPVSSVPTVPLTKVGDVTAESFQKSQFYS